MVNDALAEVTFFMNKVSVFFTGKGKAYKIAPQPGRAGIGGDLLICHLEALQKFYEQYGDMQK